MKTYILMKLRRIWTSKFYPKIYKTQKESYWVWRGHLILANQYPKSWICNINFVPNRNQYRQRSPSIIHLPHGLLQLVYYKRNNTTSHIVLKINHIIFLLCCVCMYVCNVLSCWPLQYLSFPAHPTVPFFSLSLTTRDGVLPWCWKEEVEVVDPSSPLN